MSELSVGDKAPDFTLPGMDGKPFRLEDRFGKPIVLFFYPQDDTEGCTLENQEFSALVPEFEARGALLVGISPDTVESHCKFRDKFSLRAPLLSDPDLAATKAYGLWQLKKLWGTEFMGLVRTTFIVGSDGKIAAVLKATRIRGHAQRVLQTLDQLRAKGL